MDLKNSKVYKINKYAIPFSGRTKEKIIVACFGDLHVSPESSRVRFKNIEDKLKNIKPNLIILQGDLIDSPEYLKNEVARNILKKELETCSKIAKTVTVLGNHDLISSIGKRRSDKPKFFPDTMQNWQKILDETNVTLLKDSWFEVGDLRVFGFFQDKKCQEIGEKSGENYLEMRNKIENLFLSKKLKTDPTKVNWFVAHAPIMELVTMKELKGFEVFSFGHTHGGCVPIGLDKIVDKIGWNGGIISPRKKLFPKNQTRGMEILTNRARIIVNSGMTGVSSVGPKLFQQFNFLKASEITVVEI